MASKWYDRPKFGAKIISWTGSVTILRASALAHRLEFSLYSYTTTFGAPMAALDDWLPLKLACGAVTSSLPTAISGKCLLQKNIILNLDFFKLLCFHLKIGFKNKSTLKMSSSKSDN
jgi:hypothetical protein